MNNIIAALIIGASINTTAPAAELERLTGHVTRIVDGDTIVLEALGAKHRIRLAGIDAPARNQPWGEAATRELRRQVAGQQVVVAWHYKKYADEHSPVD